MKVKRFRLLALVLALVMLLTGCSLELPAYARMMLANYIPYRYEDMTYTRPDVDGLLEAMDECMTAAAQPDFDQLEDALSECLIQYYDFSTENTLAEIKYYTDMTDTYWTEEHDYCLDNSSQVSAAMDQLLYALADSPHREMLETEEYFGEGFFDDYEGESIWDETFTALMDKESEILSEYYEISAQAGEASGSVYNSEYAPRLCQNLIELVLTRQEIADYLGYDSYHAFAYDYYYERDYTPEQERDYLSQVQTYLTPIYRCLYTYGVSGARVYSRTEKETFRYVESMAENMGGVIQEAFQRMDRCGLYDISYGENKYDASFETYLTLYNEPFVFLNPVGSDYDFLTFAHEFGHFCNDFASFGANVSIDVAEIFSQSMEYLSLFYAETDNALDALQMISSLCVYVEQSAYAAFEMRLYDLTEEELTVDNVFALFDEVCSDYGLDSWGVEGEDLTGIPHFYIVSCYVFSYVISNDAAMQLYQLEAAESGAGLAKLEENLATEEYSFLAFLNSAGLGSPFEEGRLESVAQTFRDILGYSEDMLSPASLEVESGSEM